MDIKAVNNAIDLNISNGIGEGYVNKHKTVKRVMYGYASIEQFITKMVFSRLNFNKIGKEPQKSGRTIWVTQRSASASVDEAE